MKRKTFKPKIKPFKGTMLISGNESTGPLDFIAGMGYILYMDPNDTDHIIISDKVLTYGDVRKNPEKFGVDIDWWDNTTDYLEYAKDELYLFNY